MKKLGLPMKGALTLRARGRNELIHLASTATIDLPDGYALFGHNKWQSDGTIRTDVYLFVRAQASARSSEQQH